MFQDVAEILVRAGRGGDGCSAFRREKFVPKGGPSGGDGGRGGSVFLQAEAQLTTFADMDLRPEYRAEKGRPGEGSNRTGRSGEDLVILVPPGTLVKDYEHGHTLKDLAVHGDRVLIAKGGRGGRGNASYKSATRQVPREYETGFEGESRRLLLELALVADVGLIGLPNAGKSTLLSRISDARPKIADYPFTTLNPNLGVARIGVARSFVVADIPGLIEGASEGAGLGHQFLNHVKRTRLLVHLVEGVPMDGAPEPAEAYRVIREELAAFSPELAEKPEIVVLSKTDLAPMDLDRDVDGDGEDSVLKSLADESDKEVCPISAVTGSGVNDLLTKIARRLFSEDE